MKNIQGFPQVLRAWGGCVSPPPLASFLSWGAPHGVCVGGGGEKTPPSTIGNPDIYVHMLASHFSHAQKKQTFQT